MMDITVCSYIVKNISVHIIYVISHKADTNQIFGDIGNVLPNAYTNETVFVKRKRPEFG